MALIPAGMYSIGTEVSPLPLVGFYSVLIPQDGESPIAQVSLSSFFFDKFEVSNEEFAEFADATQFQTEVFPL